MASFNYAFQTGIGLNPYLLRHIKEVVGTGNAPQLKVDNLGFLNMLQSQTKTLNVNRPGGNGAIDFVQVKYKQRLVKGQTSTSDTCASANINPYLEATVPLNIYRQVSMYVEDALIQEYTSDANQTVMAGLPPTAIMGELLEQIYAGANAIMQGIDTDLQNQIVIGTNPDTGSNASKTINITQNTANLPLTDGLTELLSNCQRAEFSTGKPQIVGSGLFLNFMNQQNAKGLAQNGLNTKIEAMGVDFYYDQYMSSTLGTNQVIAISPDAMQLVEFARFTGAYAGQKGTSYFGSIMLPMQVTPNNIIPVQFDYQLRYLDCPESVAGVDDYYGNPISGYRGWQMIISKKCGLFQIPSNAYRASDYLANSNGVLRFTITNT